MNVVATFGMSFDSCQGRYLRVLNQLRSLAESGFDVLLLCWDREGRLPEGESRDGFRIRRVRIPAPVGAGPWRNGPNVLRFNREVYRRLVENPPDVIHCYNLDSVVACYLAARRLRRKLVLDLCEPEYYGLWRFWNRWLLGVVNMLERVIARRVDLLFVHNRFQMGKFGRLGIGHLHQVGSYPNRHMLPEAVEREGRRHFVVGRLGTIYEDNGIEELLGAFRLLLERARQRPGARRYRLLLAGRVFERYRGTFDALVREFGAELDVRGAFDSAEMPFLYRELDLSVVLARRTRWFRNITPTKLFDSMVSGVPVIASDIGETAEILQEADWGLLVDETDPLSICRAIETISETEGLRDQMASRALRLARERYTWEVYQPIFLRAYAELVGESVGTKTETAESAEVDLPATSSLGTD